MKTLEIGGGDKPVYRPNMDSRRLPNVDIVADASEPWPIEDNFYDLVYSAYSLEHMSWRKDYHFIKEAHRVLKPGGMLQLIIPNLLEQVRKIASKEDIENDDICMLFGDQDYNENTHATGFSPRRIHKMLSEAGFSDAITCPHPNCKTDMIVEAKKCPNGNVKDADEIKLNIGSYTVMFGYGWTNIDIINLNDYAREKNYIFRLHDIRKGIPYPENSVDLIYSSHFIEHLDEKEGFEYLKNCHKVLKPGGVVRTTCPDVSLIFRKYKSGQMKEFDKINEDCAKAETDEDKLMTFLFNNHRAYYTPEILIKLLASVGFTKIHRMKAGESISKKIAHETKDLFPCHSLYIDAEKEGPK